MNPLRAKSSLLALLSMSFFLFACGGDGPKELVEPDLGGKADVIDQVNYLGKIEFNGEVTGEFSDDLQFDAYAFIARAQAVVTLDVTNRGSTARLDDSMFLYGPADPQGNFGANRLAQDDDSGWGAHARLKELTLAGEGSYLVVLGTANGSGRGRYRLTLTCHSDKCAPDVQPIEGCPPGLFEEMDMCMENRIYEGGDPQDVALETCRYDLIDTYYDNCEFDHLPLPWCSLTGEEFEAQVVPACAEKMQEKYPPPTLEECDDAVLDNLSICVHDARMDLDKTREEAIVYCTEEYEAERIWEYVCEDLYAPDWCEAGFSAYFETMIPECIRLMEIEDYP